MCEQQSDIIVKKVTEIIKTENSKLISALEKYNNDLLSYHKNKTYIDDLIDVYHLLDKVLSKLTKEPEPNISSSDTKNKESLTNKSLGCSKNEYTLTTLQQNSNKRSNQNEMLSLAENKFIKDIYEDILEIKESTERALSKNSVVPLNTKVGSKFDSKIHHVIDYKESNNEIEKDTILKVFKEGFIFENPNTDEKMIIRPSWIEVYK